MKRFSVYTPLLAGLLMLALQSVCAQSLYTAQLREIEKNNPVLRAAMAGAEAQRADALTGLTLADPEVSVTHLFGVPSEVPDETDIEVDQSFDFATLSGAKRKVAEAQGRVALAGTASSRAELMLQAEKALIEYTFRVQMLKEVQRRHDRLHSMHQAAEKALASGTITQLEYNSIELEALAADNEVALAEIEVQNALMELQVLNGGQPLSVAGEWPEVTMPADFDSWLAQVSLQSPEMMVLEAQVAQSAAEVNLRRKEGLPGFSVGYRSQLVKGDNYHGFAVGVTLPLWSNRGRVKAARALQTAGELELESVASQLRLTKQMQYNRARSLEKASIDLQKLYARIGEKNQAYLQNALEKGVITTLDYLQQQEDFSGHYVKYLEARRDYLLARADLYAETL